MACCGERPALHSDVDDVSASQNVKDVSIPHPEPPAPSFRAKRRI